MSSSVFKYRKGWAGKVLEPCEPGNKPKYLWVYGKTEEEADKKLTELKHKLDKGIFVQEDKSPLSVYLEKWLKNHSSLRGLAPYTVQGYKTNIYKHIIPEIGDIKLNKLTPIIIENFYAKMIQEGRVDGKGGLSGKTVTYIHRVLTMALKDAVKMELLSKNPAEYVKPPKIKKYRPNVYGESKLVDMLSLIEGHELEVAINLAVALGMRREEVLGLRWSDIDFEEEKIHVQQALIYTKESGLVYKDTKTSDSDRIIDIPKGLSDLLKKKKKKQLEDKVFFGTKYQSNGLVCCKDNGEPYLPSSFSHLFKRILTKYGLEDTTFHSLRHANATLQLKYGTDIKVVSKILGHSTTNITQDIYQHVLDDTSKKAAKKIDNGIYKKVGKKVSSI